MQGIRNRLISLLRWSERYTKTDMVYLAASGWWNNLNVVLISGFSFLLSIAFANLVPKEVFGMYQYFLSISTILGALTMTGMNYAVTQAVARGHEGVLRSSVRLQIRWGIIPFAAGLVAAVYYAWSGNGEIAAGLAIIAVFTPLLNAWNTYSAYLNGKREFRQYFLTSAANTAVYFIGMMLAIILFKSSIALLLANLAVNTIVVFLLYVDTLRRYAPSETEDDDALSFGGHLSLTNIFATFAAQLDSILVFHFLGAAPLAVYNFACAIPERIGGLFKFLVFAGIPKFSTQSKYELQRSIISKTWRAMLAGLIVALAYVAIAPVVFRIFFPLYLESLPLSQIYAFIIVATAGSIPITAIIAQQLKREIYILRTIGPIVHITLQVTLLFLYGLVGILLGRLISNFFDVGLSLILFLLSEKKAGEPGSTEQK